MNTDHLNYLLAVAQHGSLNQAAQALNLPRSYLSRVVSSLEQQLGITFFKRVPKGMIPTEEGAQALQEIQTAMGILNRLQHRAEPKDHYSSYHGKLILYSPDKMRPRNLISPIAKAYQEQFPNILLSIQEKSYTRIPEALRNHPERLALTLSSAQINHLCWEIPEDLKYISLSKTPIVALVSRQNKLAQQYQTISLASLCKQNLLLIGNDLDSDAEPLFYDLLAANGTPNVKQVVSGNMPLFYEMMETGRYFSIGMASSNPNDQLLQIPLKESILVTSGLLFDPEALEYVPARILIEMMLEHFQQKESHVTRKDGVL